MLGTILAIAGIVIIAVITAAQTYATAVERRTLSLQKQITIEDLEVAGEDEPPFVRINIAFMLPAAVEKEVYAFARELRRSYAMDFFLAPKQPLVHVTVYSPDVDRQHLRAIIEEVDALAVAAQPFAAEMQKVHVSQDGTVTVRYAMTPELEQFKDQTIERLNRYREGRVRPKYAPGGSAYDSMNESEKQDAQTYGYPVHRYHFPHVTVGKIASLDGVDTDALESKNFKHTSFRFETVGMHTMGNYGTCTACVHAVALGGNT